MEKIIPFENKAEAQKVLDNGGRFYNILTDADDGKIASAEMAAAAGVFSDKQKIWLYFELVTLKLTDSEKMLLVDQFSESLKKGYQDDRPDWLNVEQLVNYEASYKPIVLTGIPKKVNKKTELKSFIMMPVSTGSITSFNNVPIYESYQVYEIETETKDEQILIAHSDDMKVLPSKEIIYGGVLKQLAKEEQGEKRDEHFLEIIYYVEK